MRRCTLIAWVLAGCATGLPLSKSMGRSDDEQRSKFSRCEVAYYLVGLGIDAVIISADLGIGQEINGYDALLLAPVAIDALLGTALTVGCMTD